jgi:hypothetical protein
MIKEVRQVPVLVCETCGNTFFQATGRPARNCPAHSRYGGAHQKARAAGRASAYGTPCARCGGTLLPGQPVHLDHADGGGPSDYLGWSHAWCNTAAGARKGNRMRAWPGSRQPPRARVTTRPQAGPPYDPGPRRTDVAHGAGCECERMAAELGAWPSRCWGTKAPR